MKLKQWGLCLSLGFFSSIVFAASNMSQPLTVVLDWFVNPTHGPIIVAQEKGFFKQHGITVNIIAPADPSDPPKLVAAGKADIAIDYQPELYLQVSQGLPLIRIGTLIDKPLRVIAVLQTSNIKSLSDMKGKTIASSLAGLNDAIVGTMLAHNGVKLSQVTLINVHYDLVQALLSHNVDAVSSVDRNFEVPELQLAGHPARVFYPEENGVPTFDEMIFVTNKNEVNDPRLLAFMEAVQEGAEYIKAHPNESWNLLIAHHPELNNALNKASWKISLSYFALNPLALNAKNYDNFAQWMQQQGLMKTVLPLNQYAIQLSNH